MNAPTPAALLEQPEDETLTDAQRKTLAGVPSMYQPIFMRAYAGSRASAIKAFCLSCVGFTRRDITACTARGCPLYVLRPYQQPDQPED